MCMPRPKQHVFWSARCSDSVHSNVGMRSGLDLRDAEWMDTPCAASGRPSDIGSVSRRHSRTHNPSAASTAGPGAATAGPGAATAGYVALLLQGVSGVQGANRISGEVVVHHYRILALEQMGGTQALHHVQTLLLDRTGHAQPARLRRRKTRSAVGGDDARKGGLGVRLGLGSWTAGMPQIPSPDAAEVHSLQASTLNAGVRCVAVQPPIHTADTDRTLPPLPGA